MYSRRFTSEYPPLGPCKTTVLAASDKLHDLQLIAWEQLCRFPRGFRRNAPIVLHGNAVEGQVKVRQQSCQGRSRFDATRLAVDDDADLAEFFRPGHVDIIGGTYVLVAAFFDSGSGTVEPLGAYRGKREKTRRENP